MNEAERYLKQGTSAVGDPYADRRTSTSFVRRLIPHVAAMTLTFGGWACTGSSGSTGASEWNFSKSSEQGSDTTQPPGVSDTGHDRPDTDDSEPEPHDDLEGAIKNACSVAKECNPEVFRENYDGIGECVERASEEVKTHLDEVRADTDESCAEITREWYHCKLSTLQCDGGDPYYLKSYFDPEFAQAISGASPSDQCREEYPRIYCY